MGLTAVYDQYCEQSGFPLHVGCVCKNLWAEFTLSNQLTYNNSVVKGCLHGDGVYYIPCSDSRPVA